MMRGLLLARLAFLALVAGRGVQGADGPDDGALILDGRESVWRAFIVWERPMVVTKDGTTRPLKRQPHDWMQAEDEGGEALPSLAPKYPPADWAAAEFDDRDWEQQHCPVGRGYWDPAVPWKSTSMWRADGPANTGLVLARGKFRVAEPARAKALRLALSYQGGAVAYVNGREVARGHLPVGALGPETLATRYADDVYVGADGQPILGDARAESKPEELALYEKRVRRLEAAVPREALRKGINVLAIAVYPAPFSEVYSRPPKAYKDKVVRDWPPPWPHCRLLDARLSGPADAGVVPNVGRPSGVQLWQCHPWATVTGFDFGDPLEALRPIRLVAMRNGVATGQLVVSSAEAIGGLRASATDLAHKEGKGRIPAASVLVRYPLPEGNGFDGLAETAPAEVAVRDYQAGRRAPVHKAAMQLVWVTAQVPADAAPGEYEGKVSVEAEGLARTEVALELKVHDWRLPDPKALVTHNNLWPSPESLALRYRVPLWSDGHFELLGKELALTAPLANKFCMTTLICPSFCCGNTESMVRWVRKGNDAFEYDFSVLDRYLDVYERSLGKPGVLLADVSLPVHSSRRPKDGSVAAAVSLLDPATGKVGRLEQRLADTAELIAFWRPVLAEVRKRLEKRGWWDAAVLGTASDSGPTQVEADGFKAIWPEKGWLFSGHPNTRFVGKETAPVTCLEWVWGAGHIWDPATARKDRWYPMPWKREAGRISVAFPRLGAGWCQLREQDSLENYRLNPEKTLQCGQEGVGRVGLDFWWIEGDGGQRRQLTPSGGQFTFNAGVAALLAAGPDGPLPTTRSQLFREGLQVREAIICLQKALDGKGVGEELAGRIRALLEQRARNMLAADGHRHWQRDEDRLYALCAEERRSRRED